MRPGVRLGVDYGSVRIGVARSDPGGILAVPVETLAADSRPIDRLRELVAEYSVFEIIVGSPVSMSGRKGPAAKSAATFAARLAAEMPDVSVRSLDERLSTVESHRAMAAAGRSSRKSRSVIDQVAAVTILQAALDTESRTGLAPGTVVPVPGAGESEGVGG